MQTLYEKLVEYSGSDYYGFHMPGHKRNIEIPGKEAPFRIDITEIDGFDDLHHAEGILREAQERAARVYHADETHFLVNGSTAGILSAVAGATKKGDTILVARNCHKSVYHAIYLNELKPVYLYPGFDSETQLNTEISIEDVRKALDDFPQIRAAVLVSPTYDGVVSDIESIAKAVHEKGIPLIVDEAHGAHFGFHPDFPGNSNVKGADVVIHSLHKTLPALTQTALLHMNGRIVNRKRIRKYLDMLQTSSPSYVLMAGIDACIHMLESKREAWFEPYAKMLEKVRDRLGKLERLRLVTVPEGDPSKLMISTAGTEMTGRELYQMLLNEYHLQMEMAAGTYVLAMTSVGDTQEGMDRLIEALEAIDRKVKENGRGLLRDAAKKMELASLEVVCTVRELEELPEEEFSFVPWSESVGFVAAEYAYLYPPGIPLIVPGERVSQKAADMLQWYREFGFSVEGLQKEQSIEVWLHG